MTCDVSILIPVYNAREFVAEAIRSALTQTTGNLEVIIVDDASTDGSGDIIAGFDDPRIRRFRNQTNLGLVGNWNESLRHAKGRFITMLHQDDVMEPTNVERKIEALATGGRAWVASDVLQIDATGATIHEHWFQHPRALALGDQSRERQFNGMYYGYNYLCFPSVFWRREVTDTVGSFEDKGGFCVDIYMWLKFLHRYRMTYLNERLVRYRWAQNESLKYQPTDWIHDEFLAKREFARDAMLPATKVAALKALYGQLFMRRYISCRLRGDARGAGTMQRGLAALWR